MRTSLRLNNDLSPAEFCALAEAAEAAGFDQLWVSDDLMLHSATVLLTAAATRTSRIALGCGIFNPYTVHPAELAMTAASLHELSGGRFRLGLAAGAKQFLEWVGIEQRRPLAVTRDAVTAVRALLRHELVDLPGWTDQARLRTAVADVPIYLGAMSPKMLELAGEVADGALPLLYPPEHFPTAKAHIETGLARAGRNPADFDLPACVWLSLDRDRARAEAALADKIAYYGSAFSPYLLERAGLTRADFAEIDAAGAAGDHDRARSLVDARMLRLGIAGDVEDVLLRCRWLVDRGATHLSFGPPLGPDPRAAVELLGAEVLPALGSGEPG
ncbi:LLM class flavin-dependent oxidoreductase [Nocardioides anomalus]|uniref:LLM class flavin-dependent oxidoreductase n=1 Tax=Nocardioides anomalus TaxID=2712223 RepID=A0A6G6W9I3_9ACTN|nr:LLM class flavin-dependent oxidoreductase [Nocardioides anomalus]QIG42011.1 LLM class flavin-dependent oxidoreductase [Nocardioides anomalus]